MSRWARLVGLRAGLAVPGMVRGGGHLTGSSITSTTDLAIQLGYPKLLIRLFLAHFYHFHPNSELQVYHTFNRHQFPFVYLNMHTERQRVDVNLTPDKRQVTTWPERLPHFVIDL